MALLLTSLLSLLPVAQAQSLFQPSPIGPVPDGAKVTLESERTNYFLGENILIHFVLENTSTEPFTANFGGDYRGSSRSLRFIVSAVDENGQLVEDPDPNPMCLGGLGGPQQIKPGEKYIYSLPLMRYRKLINPGRYTITVHHDFGWKEADNRKLPFGETTLNLQMPDATQAEAVVSIMEKLPTNSGTVMGRRADLYSDFSCLCHPIYLDSLVRRARAGNLRALAGIGGMANTNATAALIELAGDSDPKLALNAALTLNNRLPDPEFKQELPGRGTFRFDALESRRRLSAQAWDDHFAQSVRSLAVKFLRLKETQEIGCGAFMIQATGNASQAPEVITALDRVLDPLVTPRHDAKDDILGFPQPIPELLRAMDVLHKRGFTLDSGALSGNAQIMLWFHWLENEPGPRPARWLECAKAFGDGNHYPLNETVVRSIPELFLDDCVPLVERAMANRDFGVCRSACEIAGKTRRKEFIKPLLAIAATEPHEWLLRSAGNALQSLNAGYDALEVWAERLVDEAVYPIALDKLQVVIEDLPGSYSGRTDLSREERLELRRQWKTFLATHESELRIGKKYKLKEVPPDLFGRARNF